MFSQNKLQGYTYTPIEYNYKPQLNGGLYSGESFHENAEWGNVRVEPDTAFMMNKNLLSANPPPQAMYHYPGANHRPGNNTPTLPGIVTCNGFKAINNNSDNVGQYTSECYTYCAGFTKAPKCQQQERSPKK